VPDELQLHISIVRRSFNSVLQGSGSQMAFRFQLERFQVPLSTAKFETLLNVALADANFSNTQETLLKSFSGDACLKAAN